ncbi:MAG: TerB family tellurite resistance protein [Thermoanaerobaculales bacterium]|nr:TerB family tellurite resistance protein [Thermoanaerobaculales bacterium]
MASFLQRLLGQKIERSDSEADTETVRRIVREIDRLDPERARYIAAFSFVLARVANADLSISEEETLQMEKIVTEIGGLPPEQAVLAVQIAKSQQLLMGGTENYLVTREFNAISGREEKEKLLHCLFAVSGADDSIDLSEEDEIRRISTELGFEHQEFSAIRSKYNEKRSILQNPKK